MYRDRCGWCQRKSYSKTKKKQRKYYSGKKKRHTLKSQIIINKANLKILKTNFCNGKKHDFRLLKESRLRIPKTIKMLGDTGYVGLHEIHQNSEIPKKKKKLIPLTKDEKNGNHELSSRRVCVENVLCVLKRFKVISERYRNRRKRFGLRFNLIAGIYNYEL